VDDFTDINVGGVEEDSCAVVGAELVVASSPAKLSQ
jgi:hypothetical protein